MQRTHGVHSLNTNSIPEQHKLKESSCEDVARASKPLERPMLIPKFGWALPAPLVGLLTHFLQEEFPKSDNAKPAGSGRGAKLCNSELDLLKAKGAEVWTDGQEALKKITPAEAAYLRAPWLFTYTGAMRHACLCTRVQLLELCQIHNDR